MEKKVSSRRDTEGKDRNEDLGGEKKEVLERGELNRFQENKEGNGEYLGKKKWLQERRISSRKENDKFQERCFKQEFILYMF